MLKIVHMKVNGKDVELAVDERESLLDTLRQRMGLTSVKRAAKSGNAAPVPCWSTGKPLTAVSI